jgi:hypothetical protein
MANPTSPVDGSSYRLGFIMKKVSTTLTACLTRAYANATTSGATDVAHIGIATHVEDDAAVIADATATPLVLIGAKRGSHVTVGTAGDVGALQVDTKGALMVQPAGATSFNIPTAHTAGLTETTHTCTASTQQVRLYNNDTTAYVYYRHATGVTTANGYPIPPGAQDELRVIGGTVIYLISDEASTNVRIREEIA